MMAGATKDTLKGMPAFAYATDTSRITMPDEEEPQGRVHQPSIEAL